MERSDPVRLAGRLIVNEALGGEVCAALGRERFERGEGEKVGYRSPADASSVRRIGSPHRLFVEERRRVKYGGSVEPKTQTALSS